jgi:hypothetical protein
MDEELDFDLHDLAIDEIQELLAERGAELSGKQARGLVDFVARAGGLEAALELLSQLLQQQRAA